MREAIAEAVRQRVISGLAFGTLREGRGLPGARALAREFGADPRSVLAPLRRLSAEGLLVRRPPSRAYYLARRDAVGRITGPGDAWLTEVLVGALSRGVTVALFADFVPPGAGGAPILPRPMIPNVRGAVSASFTLCSRFRGLPSDTPHFQLPT